MARRPRPVDRAQVDRAAARLPVPQALGKTSPWQPPELIEIGLRQWLRRCGAALPAGQVIGLPSRAVHDAWHDLDTRVGAESPCGVPAEREAAVPAQVEAH